MSGQKIIDGLQEAAGAYDDPSPPRWPHNGVPFNRWYRDLPAFLARLRRFRWFGPEGKHRFKYVELRIDTRNGNFLLFDQHRQQACVDEIFPEGPIAETEVDRWARRLAVGNNGGAWDAHYTEKQKDHWRKLAREFVEEFTR